MMKKVGICFSKDLQGQDPLGHIVTKIRVYLRLLDLMQKEGWEAYVLTRKTYKGGGIFDGGWQYRDGNFSLTKERIKIDLVYDRTGGIFFPPENDSLEVVNKRQFKILCWDKWATYKEIGGYMPATFLIESENDIPAILPKIKTEKVVLKPYNGLKGVGVFIGRKSDALGFHFPEKYERYIAQEFVDTTSGIPGITSGMHDLRVAVINGKAVWCHVRVPKKGTFTANAAQGGTLTEVDYEKVPSAIKNIVSEVSKKFTERYDNPIYSLDFGINSDGNPLIFEINDQIGFPKWEMKNRDKFLNALVDNFKSRLK